MRTTQQKQTVNQLLHQVAIVLMSQSPLKSQVQKQAERFAGRMRAELTEDEYKPIETMTKTLTMLATKLATAPDVHQLALAHSYAEALLQGEVLIAKDVPITDEIRASYDLNT